MCKSKALRVGHAHYHKRTSRDMAKLDVSEEELHELGEAVMALLVEKPLSPDHLRDALPEGAVRSLGAAGKKKGYTTTLPTALRYLEGEGRIRRYPKEGRLDTNRYHWGLPKKNPLEDIPPLEDDQAIAVALARHFFDWAAPATFEAFIEWSTLGKRISKAAFAALELVPVSVEGLEDAFFVLPEQIDGIDDLAKSDEVFLLPTLDNLLTLRSRPCLLADASHHGYMLQGMRKGLTALGESRWLHQRPVIQSGEWIGLWEWDPEQEDVLVGGFATLSKQTKEAAQQKMAAMASFIKDELKGAPRTHSLDNDEKQAKRADAVRELHW